LFIKQITDAKAYHTRLLQKGFAAKDSTLHLKTDMSEGPYLWVSSLSTDYNNNRAAQTDELPRQDVTAGL
jgi:hypothetical protein